MLEVTAKDHWTTASDTSDTEVAQPFFADHVHNQMQHLEKLYGCPQVSSIHSADMEIDSVSPAHLYRGQRQFSSAHGMENTSLPHGLPTHYTGPTWGAHVSDTTPMATISGVDQLFRGQDGNDSTPRTPQVTLIPSLYSPHPYLLQEDTSGWHESFSSSPASSLPLAITPDDQTISQMIIAQSYTALANNSAQLSNLQLLQQLPSPSCLSMAPTFPATFLPSQLSTRAASAGTTLVPMPLLPPSVSLSLSSFLPSSSPVASPSMTISHLAPPSPSALNMTMASSPSPSRSPTPSFHTPSSSPCLPHPVVPLRPSTPQAARLLANSHHPYLHAAKNSSSESMSQPGSRSTTPVRSRSMRDSTGSSLSLRSNNSGNNSSHDDLPSKSHSGRSSPATEYVCPVCHKCYANNSTLRRHLKIHAYACSAASAAVAAATTTTTGMMTLGVAQEQYSHAQRRHRSILVSEGDDDELEAEGDDGGQGMFSAAAAATAIKEEESDSWVALSASSRLAAASSSAKSSPRLKLTPPSSSHHLHHHHPSSSSPTFLASSAFSSSPSSSPSSFGLSMPALVTTSALLSSSILQYRPGVDTDYRKPECVGCNKAFARRDTVILHIKNIRRKWEIHWHAQKMALSATVTTDDNRRAQCNEEDMKEEAVEEDEEERVVDGDEEQEEEEEEEEEEEVNDSGTDAHRPQRSGRPKSRRDPREAARLYYADGNDSVSTAHYTSHSSHRRVTTTKKDALAPPSGRHGPKFSKEEEDELLQALAEVSPCYRERRVRMFGSFGMVEEPVLQD